MERTDFVKYASEEYARLCNKILYIFSQSKKITESETYE